MAPKSKQSKAKARNLTNARNELESRHEKIKRDLRAQIALQVAQMEKIREEKKAMFTESIRLRTENQEIREDRAQKESEIKLIKQEIISEQRKNFSIRAELDSLNDKLVQKQMSSSFVDDQVAILRQSNSQLFLEKKEAEMEVVDLKKNQQKVIQQQVQAQCRAYDTAQRKQMEQLEQKIAELVASSPTGGCALKTFQKDNRTAVTNSRCEKALDSLRKSVGTENFDDFLICLITYISKKPEYTFSLVLSAIDSFFATIKWKLTDGFLKEFKAFLTQKLGFDVFASRPKIDQLKKTHSCNENYNYKVHSIMRKVGTRDVECDSVVIEAKDLENLLIRRLECQSESGTLELEDADPLLFGVGGDKGGQTTKLVIVCGNLKNPNNPHGILLIGAYEGSDDYKSLKDNFGTIFQQLRSLKTLTYLEKGKQKTRTVLQLPLGDCKFLSSVLGHPGQSCSTPCFLCKLQWVNRGKNAARVGTFNFSEVGESYSPSELKDPLIHADYTNICPPPLHTILGIVQEYVLNWSFALCNKIDSTEYLPEDLKAQKKVLQNRFEEEDYYSRRYESSMAEYDMVKTLLHVLDEPLRKRGLTQNSESSCDAQFCFVVNAKKQYRLQSEMFRCSKCDGHFHEICSHIITAEDVEKHKIQPGVCLKCKRNGNELSVVDQKKILKKLLDQLEKKTENDEDVLSDVRKEKIHLIDMLEKSAGPTRKKMEMILRSMGCDSRAFYQSLTGNQARKILRRQNIDKILSVFPVDSSDNLDLMRQFMLDLSDLMSSANNKIKTNDEISKIEQLVFRFEENLKLAQPQATVTPKLHLLCAHLLPFLKIHKSWGHLSEQGIESYHPLVNALCTRYAPVHNVTLRWQLIVRHLTNYNFLADCGESWHRKS